MAIPFTATVDGESVQGTWELAPSTDKAAATVRTIEARVGDRAYTIEVVAVDAQSYWVKWNDLSFDVTVVENDQGVIAAIGGRRIAVSLGDARPQPVRASTAGAARRHDGKAELRAPMPGKIVRTLVSKGEAVKANQGIVVMEAMKMQNEIRSPKAGVVTSLMAPEGAPVNAGDILATVE
jgi:biotin carboxyl carrier protein